MVKARPLRHIDWYMVFAAVLLAAMGIAMIWSVTHWVPGRVALAHRQVQWLGIGLAAMVVVLLVDYTRLGRLAYPAYAAAILLLGLVLVMGETHLTHARRWLIVGGLSVQPSELAKLAFILALARYLMYRKNYRTWKGLIAPFLIALIPMGLVLVEPDLGTAMLFLPTLFVMLYVAGASPRHLGAIMAMGAACLPLTWFFLMGPSQQGRILGFLWPEAFPSSYGWHLRRSLAAVAAGGPTGVGFSSGSPVLLSRGFKAFNDFVFAAAAHEWGFVGATAVLLLFFVVFTRGAEIAHATREPFGRLIVVGMLAMLAFQMLINIGMTIRLCPITGMTLPFMSSGGSSLVTCFVTIGFVLNVGMRRKPVVAPEDFA